MFAKQTLASASLAVVLGDAALAHADPDARPPGGAAPDTHLTGRSAIGGGYSTDDRFVLRASFAQTDLFRTGNLLELDVLLSGRRQLYVARFEHPHLAGTTATIGAEVYRDVRDLPGFTRDATGVAATLRAPVGDHVTVFESYRVANIVVDTHDPIALARGGTADWHGGIVAALRAGIAYSTLDAPALATRGSSLGASIDSSAPWLGSSLDMTRVDAWATTHQPPGPLVVHLGGAVHAVSPDAPRSERLFLDGSSELRGYAPGALAPLGGTTEALGRADLELPIVRRIGLSIEGFTDAGAIVDTQGRLNLGRSVGFGAVWRTPIGPLRVDYAFPLVGAPHLVVGVASGFAGL